MPANLSSARLLRFLARQDAADGSASLRQLAEDVDDWNACLDLAREHRVATLLYRRLAELEPAIPEAIQAQLRAEFQRNYLQSLPNAAELIQILDVFKRESILAMPFK